MDDPTLERVARRLRARPEFLGWVLEQYEQRLGPAAGNLADHLGLSRRDFLRLGLYLRPRPDHFERDVRQTATDFGIDPFRLADVVRFVDAAERMSGGPAAPEPPISPTAAAPFPAPPAIPPGAGAPGYLAAARARRRQSRKPDEGES